MLLKFTGYEDDGKKFVLMRSYRVQLKKSSNSRLPRVELDEMGPRVDFQVRRLHLASDDHFAEACKQVRMIEKISSLSGRFN